MDPWYCTREDVKTASDSKETARNNTQVDRAIAGASRTIESLTHRKFYPRVATRTFDWPGTQNGRPWRLWLDANELVSVAALSSGGTTIVPGDYLLRPDTGPPYTNIELDRSGAAAFGGGSTGQRAISITGVFGHSAEEDPAGALAEALDASETGVDVTDSALIGVGQILRVDSERMIVTEKTLLTTGQTGTLTALNSATSLTVATGSAFAAGEMILLGSERMLVEDIADNTLIVKRGYDGSVLAAHTGATIYAKRRLVVQRGALGTTAATHDTATAVVKHAVPGPIRLLCIAEALNTIQQENSAYARQIGAGDTARESYSRGLKDARAEAYATYGRKARIRGV